MATSTSATSSSRKQDFLSLAEAKKDYMIGIKNKIHAKPELAFEEFKTNQLIITELQKMDVKWESIATTGVIARIGSGSPPVVGLRADMDALDIEEMVECEHKSKHKGKMHACGHDAHIAMLLGAASILKKQEKDLEGTIVLIFQPAEEEGTGAERVIEEGGMKTVEAIFGLHVDPESPLGTVGAKSGNLLAATGMFRVGISALDDHSGDVTTAMFQTILKLKEVDSALSFAQIDGGGPNHILHEVSFSGMFRAPSLPRIFDLRDKIEKVIESQAAEYGCRVVRNDVCMHTPNTSNAEHLHNLFLKVAGEILGGTNIIEKEAIMRSDDFGFYSMKSKIPVYYFFLGMHDNKLPKLQPLQTPNFKVNDKVLPIGAALLASIGINYLLTSK